MFHVKLSVTFLIILQLIHLSVLMPTPDEERYLDKEYEQELSGWLTSLLQPVNNNPYTLHNIAGTYMTPYPKRNSELINSILGLPKTMNDAGK